MKVVVVFESMFGNTAALAGEVMAGLVDAGADVALAGVESAADEVLRGCDLLVLAAPTHALTLSRPESRADAISRGGDPARAAVGLRDWLTTLVAALHSTVPPPSIAVFDTRVMKARHWPGSAARSVGRILRKSGYAVVDRESFYVEGVTGPVCTGEHDRARAWGRGLAGSVSSQDPAHINSVHLMPPLAPPDPATLDDPAPGEERPLADLRPAAANGSAYSESHRENADDR